MFRESWFFRVILSDGISLVDGVDRKLLIILLNILINYVCLFLSCFAWSLTGIISDFTYLLQWYMAAPNLCTVSIFCSLISRMRVPYWAWILYSVWSDKCHLCPVFYVLVWLFNFLLGSLVLCCQNIWCSLYVLIIASCPDVKLNKKKWRVSGYEECRHVFFFLFTMTTMHLSEWKFLNQLLSHLTASFYQDCL